MLRNCSDAVLAAVEKRYRLVREVGLTVASELAPPREGQFCAFFK